jgi:alkylation response protein AidB-like acyl-CoA dehydrogenase
LRATRPRDLLTGALLGRLRGTDGADAATLARDIGCLRDAGYLNAALPPELGGLGCTLRQAACGQRGLAAVVPRTALAVSAHLYWTGAAADAVRSGDESVQWILAEAARGALFGGGHREPAVTCGSRRQRPRGTTTDGAGTGCVTRPPRWRA